MADAILSPHGVKDEECISASLDLWSGVQVETAYDGVYWQIYHPDAPMEKSANTINFRLASHDDYTDLQGSFAKITVKIFNDANDAVLPAFVNTDAASCNSVSFVNNIASSLFTACNVRINDELLSDSYNMYNFLSYITVLFNFNSDSMKSHLHLLGFDLDENVGATADAADTAADSAQKRRAQLTKLSHELTLITPIFHPMFSQQRLLFPLTPLSLEFIKAPPALCLHSNAAAPAQTYHITKMELHMKKVKVKPSEKLRLENHLKSSPGDYKHLL